MVGRGAAAAAGGCAAVGGGCAASGGDCWLNLSGAGGRDAAAAAGGRDAAARAAAVVVARRAVPVGGSGQACADNLRGVAVGWRREGASVVDKSRPEP